MTLHPPALPPTLPKVYWARFGYLPMNIQCAGLGASAVFVRGLTLMVTMPTWLAEIRALKLPRRMLKRYKEFDLYQITMN